MNVGALAGVLRARAELRSHDRWSRDKLLLHQARSLDELRRFAVARSPLYRELHAGLQDAPLQSLPVVTKAMLMERFDDVVTDREVRSRPISSALLPRACTGDATASLRLGVRPGAAAFSCLIQPSGGPSSPHTPGPTTGRAQRSD